MAHEINNAVTGVRLNLQEITDLMREELPGGEKEEAVAQRAAESVAGIDRVATLIRRLLDAAGVRAGTQRRECVNVAAAARHAADLAQVETPAAAPIAVEAPPEIRLDGGVMGQVAFVLDALMRWCARRVAAGIGAGGDVFARVSERPGGVVLVEIGHRTMPLPDELETIFQPTVRPTAAAGGRMQFELDLLLVRAAVQAAGARIRAVPGPDSRGVLFQVEFPANGLGG
jgi:K+-sensing histidine kinase KdpD